MEILCICLTVVLVIILYLGHKERERFINLLISKNSQEYFLLQAKEKIKNKDLESYPLSDEDEARIEEERKNNDEV